MKKFRSWFDSDHFWNLETNTVFKCALLNDTSRDSTSVNEKQQSPIAAWGNRRSGYALNRVPNKWFMNLMSYFRKQIDVLIANVPVGQIPVSVGQYPVEVSVIRENQSFMVADGYAVKSISMTTRYRQDRHPRMMDLPELS